MYRINEFRLESFNIKMLEQYLKDLTFELFNKYPLVKMGMNFSDVYKETIIKCKFLNSKGIYQKNNIKFWMELFFIFGFDFLDKEQFFEIQKNLNNDCSLGELDLSYMVYDVIYNACLGFDNFDLISNILENNQFKDVNFENFVFSISNSFPGYYEFFNKGSYWLIFYNNNKFENLNEMIVKALNFNVDYRKIETMLWQ